MEALAQFCGNLAPWASLVVFLAPLPTIQKIVHDKSVGSLPLLPYTSMICSTVVWTVYGFLKTEIRIWSANGLGLLLGMYYWMRFVRYAPKTSPNLPGTVTQHGQFMGCIVIATILMTQLSPSREMATSVIGMCGVVLVLAMFASPLAVLKHVVEKKSAKSIPLPFTVASMVNCALWTIFGWIAMKDANIYVPNVLGLLCTMAQMGLKLHFGDGGGGSSMGTTGGGTDLPL